MTIKEAYEKVCKVADGFKIYNCKELSDCWLFGWCKMDNTALPSPPLRVSKETGEVTLHDEYGVSFLNGTCREMGVDIPINNIVNGTA